MLTFTWPTSLGCAFKRAPRILKTPFEGYTQRTANGLNNNLLTYSLNLTDLSPETAIAIDDFLKARGGTEAFIWTTPLETVPRKWICETHEAKPQTTVYWGVTAEFQEQP